MPTPNEYGAEEMRAVASAKLSPDEISLSLLQLKEIQNGIVECNSESSSKIAFASVISGMVSIAR